MVLIPDEDVRIIDELDVSIGVVIIVEWFELLALVGRKFLILSLYWTKIYINVKTSIIKVQNNNVEYIYYIFLFLISKINF